MKNITKTKLFIGAVSLAVASSTFLAGGVADALNGQQAGTQPPKLIIKKVLNLPESGVTTPAETFKFKFEKHSKNGKTDKKNDCPNINEQQISYTNADNTDGDAKKEGKQIIKGTTDALAGVNFSETGQYTYTVKETTNSTADMTYSQAEYLVSIFTKKDSTGNVVVSHIQIKKVKDDKGTVENNPAKKEYKPGSEADKYKDNTFEFGNSYDKKDGNDDSTGTTIQEKDKKGFVLEKKVKGTNSNQDEKFKFKIKAEKPIGSNSTETKFNYYVVDKAGKKGEKKEGTYVKDFEVELKDSERIVFGKILLGSKVSAQETFDGGYTQSLANTSKMNGTNVTTVDALKTGMVIGDGGENVINFENTQQSATGILLNNLPFIALILVAAAGIVFFIKNRKKEELEA